MMVFYLANYSRKAGLGSQAAAIRQSRRAANVRLRAGTSGDRRSLVGRTRSDVEQVERAVIDWSASGRSRSAVPSRAMTADVRQAAAKHPLTGPRRMLAALAIISMLN